MFTFDWTIHMSDVAVVGAGILAFFKMFLSQRDLNNKVLRILLGEEGKNGIVSDIRTLRGDVYVLQKDMNDSGGMVARIRHSIVTLRLAMAARGVDLRDEDQP